MRRSNLLMAGGALMLLLLFSGFIPGLGPVPGNASESPCEGVEGDTPTLYNQQTDDLAFGPSVGGELEQVKAELHKRRCLDPALTAAHAIDAELDGWPFPSSDEEWQDQWGRLIGDRELWLKVIGELEAQEAEATADLFDDPEGYHSMWFLDGPEGQYGKLPFLRQGPGHAGEAGMTLRFTWSDGTVRQYRLSCGFQPVRHTPFPEVPPVEQPPCDCPPPTIPTTTTVPPCENCGPTTTVPPTTTPCPPPAGVPADKWDPVKCEKIDTEEEEEQNGDTGVGQEPQDNSTSGVDVGPTTDSDGTPIVEPVVQPATPVDNRTNPAPAPDPTPTGTNSGSSGGSGTPSGSLTDDDGNTTVGDNNTSDPVDTGQGGEGNGEADNPFG